MPVIILADPSRDGHRTQNVLSLSAYAHVYPDIEFVFLVHPWVAGQVKATPGSVIPPNVKIKTFQNDKDADLTVHPRDLSRAAKLLRQISKQAALEHADLVHLLHLEPFLVPLVVWDPLQRPARWSGLLFYSAIHYPERFGAALPPRRLLSARVRHILVRRLLARSNFALIQTDDPYYLEYLKSEKGRVIPEHSMRPPGEQRPGDLPREWEESSYRILCFGALSQRHGIFQLCEALESVKAPAGTISVLFGGKIVAAAKSQFLEQLAATKAMRSDIHIFLLNRFLDDQEILWAVNRASLIAAPYQRMVGSSSVMCWAARAGVPILTQDWGLLGTIVSQHHLGETVDTTQPALIAEKLSALISGRPPNFDRTEAEKFAASNSVESFGKTYLAQLVAAVGSR